MTVKEKIYLLALAALLAVACNEPLPGNRAGLSSSAVEAEDMRLIATLAAGRGAGEVSLRLPNEEAIAGGPAAIAVDANGVIHIADTLADRIVRIRPDGTPLSPLEAVAVEDVIVDGEGFVYAFSRRDFRVTVMTPEGQPIEIVEIPRTMRWVTGLCLLPEGTIGLHTAYQESVPLRAQSLQRELSEGVPGLDGGRYRTIRRDGAARIELVAAGEDRTAVLRRLDVNVVTALGSLGFLGATRTGEIVVDVQDVIDDSPITVERTIRRYRSSGALIAERAVPRGLFAPSHALEMDAEGTVYVLRPTVEGLEIWAWSSRGGVR